MEWIRTFRAVAVLLAVVATGVTPAAAQEPVASAGPGADGDALCVAAILPGVQMMSSISRNLSPDEEWDMERKSVAMAYFLGALTARHSDAAASDRAISSALSRLRDVNDAEFAGTIDRCIDDAFRHVDVLEDSFPIWRRQQLLGE